MQTSGTHLNRTEPRCNPFRAGLKQREEDKSMWREANKGRAGGIS